MVLRFEGYRRPDWGATCWEDWGGEEPGKGVVGFTPGFDIISLALSGMEDRALEGGDGVG